MSMNDVGLVERGGRGGFGGEKVEAGKSIVRLKHSKKHVQSQARR